MALAGSSPPTPPPPHTPPPYGSSSGKPGEALRLGHCEPTDCLSLLPSFHPPLHPSSASAEECLTCQECGCIHTDAAMVITTPPCSFCTTSSPIPPSPSPPPLVLGYDTAACCVHNSQVRLCLRSLGGCLGGHRLIFSGETLLLTYPIAEKKAEAWISIHLHLLQPASVYRVFTKP